MQDVQVIKPVRLNLDDNKKYLEATDGFFILNQQVVGGKTEPLYANDLMCVIQMPAGETYTIGSYYCREVMQEFAWHWNSLGHHFITRKTDEKGCEVVYQGPCIPLSIEPKHAPQQFRAYLIVDKNRSAYYLVWSFGFGPIGFLDVETSIATNSFQIPFFQECEVDPCDYVQLEVKQPQKCITAEPSTINTQRSSTLTGRPWQWRYRFTYYDGRRSEWSPISSMYWIDAAQCSKAVVDFNCFELTIPSGNPFVAEIELAFRNNNDPNWFRYDTIKKYGDPAAGYYYGGGPIGGGLSSGFWNSSIILPDYDDQTCSFKYQFCNDKECVPIDVNDTNRIFNPIPNTAQGILPIDNRLGFYNVETGQEPLPKSELDKISFTTKPSTSNCDTETVVVKFAAIIYSPENEAQFVYRLNGENEAAKDDLDDKAYFGGLQKQFSVGGGLETGYGQEFTGKTRNFIAYIAGTEQWVELKQYRVVPSGEEEVGVIPRMGTHSSRAGNRRRTKAGEYFLQRGEFKVKRGSRGFIRLAGHSATGNEQGTSTYVMGVLNNRNLYLGNTVIQDSMYSLSKEVWFNACTASDSIDLSGTPFIIADLAINPPTNPALPNFYRGRSTVVHGYIKDKNGVPLELLRIKNPGTLRPGYYVSRYTDHNGFYFAALQGRADLQVIAETVTGFDGVVHTIQENQQDNREVNIINIDLTQDSVADDFQRRVSIKVIDCLGQPIPGISVVLAQSAPVFTNMSGVATVTARNNEGRNRRGALVVMQGTACAFRDCNNQCNPCMYFTVVDLTGSFTPITTTDLGTVTYKLLNNTEVGLKSGGRYGLGLAMMGNGRFSFIQEDNWYIDIPSIQQRGSYALNGIVVDISGSVAFESWVEKVSFWRTANLKYPSYLQWIVDEVEYVDQNGNPAAPISASHIRLTIQSLNDYNKTYNFKTNTIYQYNRGDRVEVIANGNGKVYAEVIDLIVQAPWLDKDVAGIEEPPADFFNQLLVLNDSRLFELEKGALIEIKLSKTCSNENVYYEICQPIDVDQFGGQIFLNCFDTFKLNRTIPNATTNFSFEHHSVSDFWGDNVNDQGRMLTKSQYERERRYGRDIWLSDTWNISGNTMGVNRFWADARKRFSGTEQGDIIAMSIKDSKVIMGVCEVDNFIAQTGDEFARVGNDGIIKAVPGSSIISDGQPKLEGQYGCNYDQVGSIRFGDAFATWVDGSRGPLVFHDYQSAKPVDKVLLFFSDRTRKMMEDNSTADAIDKWRFSTGFDPEQNCVYITSKKLRQPAVKNDMDTTANQTMILDVATKSSYGWASFTPDCYGEISTWNGMANVFISYFQGNAYVHYRRDDKRNEFYGIPCDRIIGFVCNASPSKLKRFLSMEIQSRQMYYATEVTTDGDYVSEIPPIKVRKAHLKWNAEFLGNKNSRAGLYGTSAASGYAMACVLVRDNSDDLKYRVYDNAKRILYDELDYILVKFVAVEQSGFSNVKK